MKQWQEGKVRTEISRVATHLFADLGYSGVPVRLIATAANIAMPTIYHYLGSKKGSYDKVETAVYRCARQTLVMPFHAKGTNVEILSRFIAALMDLFERDITFYKFIQRHE